MAGIHHVSAIAGGASRNVDFYTRTLGLRLVKKTVNCARARTLAQCLPRLALVRRVTIQP